MEKNGYESKTTTKHDEALGLVVKIYRERRFGFIKPITDFDAPDIFFHRDAVCEPDFSQLREGQTVEYIAVTAPDTGERAIGIKVIDSRQRSGGVVAI